MESSPSKHQEESSVVLSQTIVNMGGIDIPERSNLDESSSSPSNSTEISSPAAQTYDDNILNQAWVPSPNSWILRIPKSEVLKGVIAFVDVWSKDGQDNRSLLFQKVLTRMGAIIAKKMVKDVNITHLVFQHGHKSYLSKAKSRNIKVVTWLWVDKCRIYQQWQNEDEFLFNDSNYVPPKKFVNMAPLSEEEKKDEEKRFVERMLKKDEKKQIRWAKRAGISSPLLGGRGITGILAPDSPFIVRTPPERMFHPNLVHETPGTTIYKKLQRLKEGKPIFTPPSPDSPRISPVVNLLVWMCLVTLLFQILYQNSTSVSLQKAAMEILLGGSIPKKKMKQRALLIWITLA